MIKYQFSKWSADWVTVVDETHDGAKLAVLDREYETEIVTTDGEDVIHESVAVETDETVENLITALRSTTEDA
jgi:hypothetical protein